MPVPSGQKDNVLSKGTGIESLYCAFDTRVWTSLLDLSRFFSGLAAKRR